MAAIDDDGELNDSLLLDEIEDIKHGSDDDHDFIHKVKKEEGEGPWLISYADMMTLLMGFFALIASVSTIDQSRVEKVKQSAVEKFGGEYVEPYKDLKEKIQEAVKAAHAQDKVQVTSGADGVSLKFQGTSLFDSGAFEIKTEGAQTIDSIVNQIQNQVKEYKVTIEGHTDNVPITHPIIASNWELSAIRAARVAQLFERRGFSKEQLIIQGWGETRPEAPNLSPEGVAIPANQALNRRVIIKISNKEPLKQSK